MVQRKKYLKIIQACCSLSWMGKHPNLLELSSKIDSLIVHKPWKHHLDSDFGDQVKEQSTININHQATIRWKHLARHSAPKKTHTPFQGRAAEKSQCTWLSGQIIIFHQPGFSWIFRGFPFLNATFWGLNGRVFGRYNLIWSTPYRLDLEAHQRISWTKLQKLLRLRMRVRTNTFPPAGHKTPEGHPWRMEGSVRVFCLSQWKSTLRNFCSKTWDFESPRKISIRRSNPCKALQHL